MKSPRLRLYGFFNSSASYRVRIALELKGLAWETIPVNIRTGEQNRPPFREINPNGLVPTLEDEGQVITQSLAIIDYLDTIQPDSLLIPASGNDRHRALEIALVIGCEIHPLNNLRVLKHLMGTLGLSDVQKNAWYAHWVMNGFDVLEKMVPDHDGWCIGQDKNNRPTVADCFLIPQVANALRMKIDLSAYPRILRINNFCLQHPAFRQAAPSAQPDYIPT